MANNFTSEEINDFIGLSESDDGSDWEDLEVAKVNDFLKVENPEEKPKKIFEKIIVESKTSTTNNEKSLQNNLNKSSRKYEKPITNVINKVQDSKYFIVTPTKIRVLKNNEITSEIWKERTSGRQVLTVSKLCRENKTSDLANADWILAGVLAQITHKTDKKNSKYSIWYLNDLQNMDKCVKVLLFREIHEAYWKESAGCVIAILQPKMLPQESTYKDKTPTFTVDNSLQIMILGRSPDFGICQGKSKLGDNCRNIVNKATCSLCSFHVSQGYYNATNRPGFVNPELDKNRGKKRPGPPLPWMDEKRAKPCGVIVNSRINSQLSFDKLHNSGITKLATHWGLLDSSIIDKIPRNKEISSQNLTNNSMTQLPQKYPSNTEISHGGSSNVPLVNQGLSVQNGSLSRIQQQQQQQQQFTNLLKRPTAGSLNLVKSIVEKSIGSSALGSTVVKHSRIHDTGQATAAPGVTLSGLKKMCEIDTPKRDDPQKYVELGMKPVNLDKVSGEVYRAELAKLRYTAIALKQGGYSAMKENNKQDRLKKINATAMVSKEILSKKPVMSAEMLKLLNMGSSNKHLVDIQKSNELDDRLDRMEKIDQMEIKLSAQHEQACILFHCVQCKTRTPMKSRMCVAEGHKIETKKGIKRFFHCIKCKHRTTTLDKYPSESCIKCGACAYEKTGKLKEREVVEEKLLVHGNENRFINN